MHAHELLHQIAAIVLLIAGAFFLLASWVARKKAFSLSEASAPEIPAVDPRTTQSSLSVSAAVLAIAAGLIHLAVIPHHAGEFVPSGIALGVVAGLQFAIGLAAVTGRWSALLPGATAFTLSVIAVWLLSRTAGIPIGPQPWTPEPIGLADGTATALEILLVGTLIIASRHAMRGRVDQRVNDASSIAIIPFVGVVALATLMAVVSVVGGTSDHHHGSAATGVDDALPIDARTPFAATRLIRDPAPSAILSQHRMPEDDLGEPIAEERAARLL